MNITLDDAEIKLALAEYVNKQGISIANKSVEVTLIAGRGSNGHSASIAIREETDPTPELAVVETTEPTDKESIFQG